MKTEQAGCLGDILERAVAVVAQQRVGMQPRFAEPAAADHVDVRPAVVVVVGMVDVDAAELSEQARLARPVGETAPCRRS